MTSAERAQPVHEQRRREQVRAPSRRQPPPDERPIDVARVRAPPGPVHASCHEEGRRLGRLDDVPQGGTPGHLVEDLGQVGVHPLALAAHAPHPNAGKVFIGYVLSKEGQLFIRNTGRVVSRSDIPQEEFARTKVISEDVTIADRLNQVIADYKKYLR